MITIEKYLSDHGPSRSSLVVAALVESGVSPVAARQRVSRVQRPVRKFPVPMLPKKEAFLYLEKDRNKDWFWKNFLRDLRETNSVFAAAIDGIIARGGLIRANQFDVISGATANPKKGQLMADTVAKRLLASDFIKEEYNSIDGKFFVAVPSLALGSTTTMRAREATEKILLDGLREWCRKLGLASYNLIKVRDEETLQPIGPFAFDMAGPSYLLPLQGPSKKPGFVVADVFAEGILDINQIQFFIRKARILKSTLKDIGILSIIVAEGFTGEALTAGHAAGVMLATPKDIFGTRVGLAITSLCNILKNAAKYASSNPERLTKLLDNLSEMEGRNNNIRGILFELIVGYLARRNSVSIDMGVKATDPRSGKLADIDVQAITQQGSSVTAIECKGKEPGGVLTLSEVEEWLSKIPIFRAHYANTYSLREATHRFEIWTSGTIAVDALEKLQSEKQQRTAAPIDWKDGQDILALARTGKEKSIVDALNQHYLSHPLAEITKKN